MKFELQDADTSIPVGSRIEDAALCVREATLAEQSTRKRGRPPKFDDATAFELLVDEGVRRLRDSGYEPGLAAVNLDQAIRATKVPRGAAYRLWENTDQPPQEQYRSAVLLRIFDREVGRSVFRELDRVIAGAVAAVAEDIDSGDPDRRMYAGRSLIRTISSGLQAAVRNSDGFRMSRSLARTATELLNVSPEIRVAMVEAEESLVAHYAASLERIFDLFDAGIRPPYTFEQVVVLINALNDGLLEPRPGIESTTVSRPTGPNGELQEWSLFALGYEAIVAHFSDDPLLRGSLHGDD